MDNIPIEIISSIAKRASKLSLFFLFYSLISIFLFITVIIYKKIYVISNLEKINGNLYSFLEFLITSSFISFLFYLTIYVLKGESDLTIRKLRNNFYKKAIERVNEVVKYRFEFQGYNEDIKNLTEYSKYFEKNGKKHIVKLKNLKSFIVSEIDTLYFLYQINNNEKILWSIWHSGDFLAIAIAIEKNLVKMHNIEEFLKKTFNLTNHKEFIFSERDKYLWFDVKFNISDEFLINNIEKEKMSRRIAHFVSIGIIVGLEILGWKKLEFYLVED